MALPKQTRKQNLPNGAAHAPYNFVPLPQQVVTVEGELPNHDRYTGLSGWIDCDLETLSPLYVRGMLSEKTYMDYAKTEVASDDLPPAVQQERARFFAVGERVIIPGSSLRGMVRTLVEIAGFGKLQQVGSEQRFFYRAVAAPKDDPLGVLYKSQMGKVKAGYVEKHGDNFFICPAQDIQGESYIKAQDKDKSKKRSHIISHSLPYKWLDDPDYHPDYVPVSFTWKRTPKGRIVADQVDKAGMLKLRGVMICSGNMSESSKKKPDSPRRNHCIVAEKNTGARSLPIPAYVVEDYLSALTDFQKEPPFNERVGCLIVDRPIFYLDNGSEVTAFGHSPNFRFPYKQQSNQRASTVRNFVPQGLLANAHATTLDFAEALFGYVGKGKDKKEARAGRVLFEDARTVDGQSDVMLGKAIITPQILGTPKPSTFQHYLVQPDDAANNRLSLKHYASTPSETVIRGHKLYWHRGNVSVEQFKYPHTPGSDERKQAKKQLTGIRPVKSGVKFTFRLRFENLSLVELGALLWVLELPAGHAHKLGMAKPLGLGSVRIKPTLQLHDRASRYQSLFAGDGWQLGAPQPNTIADAKKAFESYMLARIQDADFDAGRSTSFADVTRIRELLCLLELPANENARFDQTKYMTIEPENEYKRRPILPLPSIVAGKPAPLPTTPVATGSQVANVASTEEMPDLKTLLRGEGTLERRQTRDGEMIYVKDGDLRLEVRRERLKAAYNTLPGNGRPVTYQYDEVSGQRRVWMVQRTLQTKGL